MTDEKEPQGNGAVIGGALRDIGTLTAQAGRGFWHLRWRWKGPILGVTGFLVLAGIVGDGSDKADSQAVAGARTAAVVSSESSTPGNAAALVGESPKPNSAAPSTQATATFTQPAATVPPPTAVPPTAVPTSIPPTATATRIPPTSTLLPLPTATPATAGTSGIRVGAVCKDGTTSTATGSGACSHHGGVAYWLYR